MRCTYCGYSLQGDEDTCPRCQGDLSSSTRLRAHLGTLLMVAIATVIVSLLAFAVLHWHDTQAWDRTLGPTPSVVQPQPMPEQPQP